MFTGIIECLGHIKSVEHDGTNIKFGVQSTISHELKIDQSVAHDGVCLTVIGIDNDTHYVTAIQETLSRTSLNHWQVGRKVNLERCLKVGDRLDGHWVQGHADTTGICKQIVNENGSWVLRIEYLPQPDYKTVEKGSITLNGTSLTVVESGEGYFTVAIIPYTYEHTTIHQMKVGDTVNLEFDIIGKWVKAWLK
jgi:riboflavin synthase